METVRVSVQFLYNEREKDLFAYFPFEIQSPRGSEEVFRMAYSHVGQHSSCSPAYAKESRPATYEEYAALQLELQQRGYELDIIEDSPKVNALYKVALSLYDSFDKTSAISNKEYGYLSDLLDDITIGFFKEMPDGDYQQELYSERFSLTEQEAIEGLQHRIKSILEDLESEEEPRIPIDYWAEIRKIDNRLSGELKMLLQKIGRTISNEEDGEDIGFFKFDGICDKIQGIDTDGTITEGDLSGNSITGAYSDGDLSLNDMVVLVNELRDLLKKQK